VTLSAPLVPPEGRLAGLTQTQLEDAVRWHEDQAARAMNSLHCGSENWEYREAHKLADLAWAAASALRLHLVNHQPDQPGA